ncbi:unnamed protein product [Allacma fusca]|uniref:Uncharacterized protein n=1 Tax=Allacma fusca TaxID=39272 RepID=A0A8J2LIM1_9HEXA|nr:unnamed protein product [Allacma fusca]
MDGEGTEDDDIGDLSQQFHNTVRENIIYLIFFLTLAVCSWAVTGGFLKRKDRSQDDEDDSESVVYGICFWICVFSLSIATGAALLLPMSVIANEVLLLYPKTYYIQWLNDLLIQGLWNLIFLFANTSLFILLPFAYFFIESEGFSGHKKGVSSKFKEAVVVLILAAFTVWGMAYILALVLSPERSTFSLDFGIFVNQLPFMYSCISFLGVLLLLVCTPTGSAHLFTVLGQFIVGPQFIRNIEEEYTVAMLELESLKNVLKSRNGRHNGEAKSKELEGKLGFMSAVMPSGVETSKVGLLGKLEQKVRELDVLKKSSKWKTNFIFPCAYVILLVLTGFTVLLVVLNTLQLLFGVKALPVQAQPFALGLSSVSVLGTWGAALEIIIIFYLMTTSVIGLYNLPGIRKYRPRFHDSPISHIIYNCGYLLVLSSALPVLARILGITNFDLLGNYGKIEWLGNFYIVFLTNIIFSAASILCLASKFTLAIRQELYKRLRSVFRLTITDSKSGGPQFGLGKED